MIFRHSTELALVALLKASIAPRLWAVYIRFHSIRLENRGESIAPSPIRWMRADLFGAKMGCQQNPVHALGMEDLPQ
jgi:hypothetical protein